MANREWRRRRGQPPIVGRFVALPASFFKNSLAILVGSTTIFLIGVTTLDVATMTTAFVVRQPLLHLHNNNYALPKRRWLGAMSAVDDPSSADIGGTVGTTGTGSSDMLSTSTSTLTTTTSTESMMTTTTIGSSSNNNNSNSTRRFELRRRVAELARRRLTAAPWLRKIAPMPRAVAVVLRDATFGALDLAVDEVLAYRNRSASKASSGTSLDGYDSSQIDAATAMIEEAFLPLENLITTATTMDDLVAAVAETKSQCLAAVEAMEAANMAQAQGAAQTVAALEEVDGSIDGSTTTAIATTSKTTTTAAPPEQLRADVVAVDFADMAPPFLDEDSCLVPGEPIVRVERAPENSRRIFAGIDIPVAVDAVWALLTDYENLQRAVPNLVVNNVLALYDADNEENDQNDNGRNVSVKERSKRMKGALLRQVGGAKVAGIQFSARTTLEVREWPDGLPAVKDHPNTSSEDAKLERYKFPRPYALSRLPTKDITMQSTADDDGEFRMYQGVWRMQPLPGCSPPGRDAMRLTYAVEISPRAYLPVQLIERRIVTDLCRNLIAIRDYVTRPDQTTT